jgi:putative addiction module component (TIGR02574 family)
MTKPVQIVLADALRLDPDARAELVAEILASVDGPAAAAAESAWDTEIERRIQAIESGEIRLAPWESVKRRIEKDILGRPSRWSGYGINVFADAEPTLRFIHCRCRQ